VNLERFASRGLKAQLAVDAQLKAIKPAGEPVGCARLNFKSPPPLTLKELNQLAITHRETCGCGERTTKFKSRCHPNSKVECVFCEDCQMVHVLCGACEKLIVNLKIEKGV
jgi:hypothetical protein